MFFLQFFVSFHYHYNNFVLLIKKLITFCRMDDNTVFYFWFAILGVVIAYYSHYQKCLSDDYFLGRRTIGGRIIRQPEDDTFKTDEGK